MNDASTTVMTAEADELDALLGGLDIPDETIVDVQAVSDVAADDVIEEPATEDGQVELAATDETILDEETASAIEAEMQLQEAREEVYASHESGPVIDLAATDVTPATPAAAKPKKAAGPAKTRTPRISVDALPVDAFVLTTLVPDDLEANKAAVIRACPAQKKVQEKFENLLVSIHQGKAPSTYVMDCFRALDAAGEITSSDMVAVLKATSTKNGSKTYAEGTARSQVGQIMSLFPALKIATRAGNKLTVNPDSLLVEALRTLAAGPAPAEAA
ncbi:hypothetical protein ABID82_005052 [Methylobacterium sp. PvP062]|uniref:Uncharacterized protein n=1 Tax=Methylobacterium radiotolerans TaxID=31998 RepID=A0ABV2NU16_9HYPH|nr:MULTISPECIES: hypothetical protein [unclassified Methylobacterium]MBP2498366.1 hypothetical protein [Methylobacterium sp. PvP105]MBP2505750.1 hypothetical protein [Methylobacterium sp. PvP109]